MNILVTGASGFVGSQIVTDLLKQGHDVTCCGRNVSYAKKLFPTSHVISCDFQEDTTIEKWLPRLKDIDVVINTVGIFYHPNKKIIWQTHFETPRALFDACVQMNIKKIIQISALGVDKYDVDYARSKLAADKHLLNLSIPSIILRPSLIYGRGSFGGTSLFRGLSALPFIIPVPGNGKQTFQPIYLPDLSLAITKLVNEPLAESKILNAVSTTKIELKEILTTLRQWLGLPTAMMLYIPKIFIRLGSFLGDFVPNSTMNSAGYKMMTQNIVATKEQSQEFADIIGFTPNNFVKGMFSQPSTVQDRWHAKLYFAKPLLQFSLAFLWLLTAVVSIWFYPRATSYELLQQVGINNFWQPIFLYGASVMDFFIGLALLFNFQVKNTCILQALIIIIYTLIITIALPQFWLEPFGPISKNIPLLVAIYILYVLETNR